MSFTIKICKNNSDVNVVSKNIVDITDVTGTLKTATSIINPVIEISGSLPITANYMYIAEFARYYFIDDIRSTGQGRYEISAHVDVLMTYGDKIRACTGIIARQENAWNLYVDDGTFKVYQNPKLTMKKFPSGFTTQEFVLAIAGS